MDFVIGFISSALRMNVCGSMRDMSAYCDATATALSRMKIPSQVLPSRMSSKVFLGSK